MFGSKKNVPVNVSGLCVWAWSLIRNKKNIVIFDKNCYATEKSEAISCERRCRSSRLTWWWTQKKKNQKKGREAQGVADQK
jgi:hypothetical protein